MTLTETIKILSFLKSHHYDVVRDAYGRIWAEDVSCEDGKAIVAYTMIPSLSYARRWAGY